MNRFGLLGVALGAMLALALLLSRALVDAPIDLPVTRAFEPALAPAAPVSSRAPPPAVAQLPSPSVVAVVASPLPAPASPSPAPPALDPEPAPDAENPFINEASPEIDYAFELVYGPASTVDTARVAAEVFERCLKQAPDNHRCIRGLVAAQQRQQPDWVPPSQLRVPLAPLDPPSRASRLRSRLPATAREAQHLK